MTQIVEKDKFHIKDIKKLDEYLSPLIDRIKGGLKFYYENYDLRYVKVVMTINNMNAKEIQLYMTIEDEGK